MKLFEWLKRREKGLNERAARWRAAWTRAVDAPGDGSLDAELRRELRLLAGTEPDVEIETEMLDALDQLRALQRSEFAGALPVVETHHKVIGTEPCHFSAPASMRSGEADAAGRVLLTGTRAVFVGGGRSSATAWHAVHEVVRLERDLVLIRADRSPAAHFRFNTYADAVAGAFLARRLKGRRRASL